MKIISFISQKGGVGKTTLAIHLAVAFAADGLNVAVLDLDPQASAAEWKDFREQEMPGVIAIPSSRLPKVLKELETTGADIVILDTAPHSEGTALDAARAADLILVPCQPSIMDLRAMRKTTDLLRHIKKPTYAVLNGVSVQGSAALGTEKAIAAEFKIDICPVRMGDRVAYSRCLISGHSAQEYEPEGKASREVHKFHKWVSGLVGLSAKRAAA
ncbi:MAG: ParA family partition ATPase [Rhodopila sp.]